MCIFSENTNNLEKKLKKNEKQEGSKDDTESNSDIEDMFENDNNPGNNPDTQGGPQPIRVRPSTAGGSRHTRTISGNNDTLKNKELINNGEIGIVNSTSDEGNVINNINPINQEISTPGGERGDTIISEQNEGEFGDDDQKQVETETTE